MRDRFRVTLDDIILYGSRDGECRIIFGAALSSIIRDRYLCDSKAAKAISQRLKTRRAAKWGGRESAQRLHLRSMMEPVKTNIPIWASSRIQIPESIVNNEDLSWGPDGRLCIEEPNASELMEKLILWVFNTHRILSLVEIRAWEGVSSINKPVQDRAVPTSWKHVPIIGNHLRHGRWVWFTRRVNSISEIDTQLIADLDAGLIIYLKDRDMSYLENIGSGNRLSQAERISLRDQQVRENLKSLILEAKVAADEEERRCLARLKRLERVESLGPRPVVRVRKRKAGIIKWVKRSFKVCQLRRLGARGGAGKPTLLSLKN
jgi:hypothetical protein